MVLFHILHRCHMVALFGIFHRDVIGKVEDYLFMGEFRVEAVIPVCRVIGGFRDKRQRVYRRILADEQVVQAPRGIQFGMQLVEPGPVVVQDRMGCKRRSLQERIAEHVALKQFGILDRLAAEAGAFPP